MASVDEHFPPRFPEQLLVKRLDPLSRYVGDVAAEHSIEVLGDEFIVVIQIVGAEKKMRYQNLYFR